MRDTYHHLQKTENPEIHAKLHLPILCIITQTPQNTTGPSTREIPQHSVCAQILKSDLSIDPDIPELQDIPVAIPFASHNRGLISLPKPGTICEIAFAYGSPTLPYIRTSLPYNLTIPAASNQSITIAQNPISHIQIQDQNINLTTPSITQLAQEIHHIAQKIKIGNQENNLLELTSQLMHQTAMALLTLSTHTHPYINVAAPAITSAPSQSPDLIAKKTTIETLKSTLDTFTL